MVEIQGSQIAEYDNSFSTNTRINALLCLCNESMMQDDAIGWHKSCKGLLLECSISIDCDKNEEGKYSNEFNIHKEKSKKIEEKLIKWTKYIKNYRPTVVGDGTTRNVTFKRDNELFNLLFDWELILRKKLDKMGILMKRGDKVNEGMA